MMHVVIAQNIAHPSVTARSMVQEMASVSHETHEGG